MVRCLLVHPPVTDPTSGYHSICYLDAAGLAQGFTETDLLDANIEALHHLAEPARVDALCRRNAERLNALEADDDLSPESAAELFVRWKCSGVDARGVSAAMEVMRDADRFFDPSTYVRSAAVLAQWHQLLSADAYPGQFGDGFELAPYLDGGYSLQSVRDLTSDEVLDRICAPYLDYVRGPFLANARDYDAVGVSVTYWAQLPFALVMGRELRRAMPEVTLWVGGTEVSDVWKYVDNKDDFYRVFASFDRQVVGEGESAFVELLLALKDGRRATHPNLRPHQRPAGSDHEGEVTYEVLASLPTPSYDKLPWDKYLSPEPFVYFSPTRGCYWNKCTFCDYGLNTDGPTSPWRQLPLARMVEDVQALGRTYPNVYLSVDVLAPAAMERLARALSESASEVRWGAEIRLEKFWTEEKCAALRAGGCVAVSVGFESGNQRVLDLIDKGVTVDRVSDTLANLHAAGVAVQMMGFVGFPSETTEEAMESVDFLRRHRHEWTFGGLGEFTLTPGSIVAKQPQRFAIADMRPGWGPDIARVLDYEETRCDKQDMETIRAGVASLEGNLLDRPWLGGVDTPHTFMYHARYGTDVREVLRSRLRGEGGDGRWILNGRLQVVPAGVARTNPHLAPGEPALVRSTGLVERIPPEVAPYLQGFADHATSGDDAGAKAGLGAAMSAAMLQLAIARSWVVAGPSAAYGCESRRPQIVSA